MLADDRDPIAAEGRSLLSGRALRGARAQEHDVTGGRQVEASEKVEERRLAGAGRARHRVEAIPANDRLVGGIAWTAVGPCPYVLVASRELGDRIIFRSRTDLSHEPFERHRRVGRSLACIGVGDGDDDPPCVDRDSCV